MQTKNKDADVGIVVEQKPESPIGASWVPERYVIWWLGRDSRTTEFIGTGGLDLIQVISPVNTEANEVGD